MLWHPCSARSSLLRSNAMKEQLLAELIQSTCRALGQISFGVCASSHLRKAFPSEQFRGQHAVQRECCPGLFRNTHRAVGTAWSKVAPKHVQRLCMRTQAEQNFA